MLYKPAKENITVAHSNKCWEYRGRIFFFFFAILSVSSYLIAIGYHTPTSLQNSCHFPLLTCCAIPHKWHFQINELKKLWFLKKCHAGLLLRWIWNGGSRLNAPLWEALHMLVNQQTFEFWTCLPIKHMEVNLFLSIK